MPVCGNNGSDLWQCLWGGETININALCVARSIFLIMWLILSSWGLPSKIFHCIALLERPFSLWMNWDEVIAVLWSLSSAQGGVAGYFLSIKFCTVSKQSQSQNSGEEESKGSCDGIKSVTKLCVRTFWNQCQNEKNTEKCDFIFRILLLINTLLRDFWIVWWVFLIENLLSVLERHG